MIRYGLLSPRSTFTASDAASWSHFTGVLRPPHPASRATDVTMNSVRIRSLPSSLGLRIIRGATPRRSTTITCVSSDRPGVAGGCWTLDMMRLFEESEAGSGCQSGDHQMAKTIEKQELTEVSEAQIAVHWKEEEYYQPSEKFKAQANMRDPRMFDRFGLDRFPDCFKEYADMLTWFEPYRTVLDTSDAPFWKWFAGGKINACYNCVDRHLAKYGNKAAFIFVAEPDKEPDVSITYQELYDRVNELAA